MDEQKSNQKHFSKLHIPRVTVQEISVEFTKVHMTAYSSQLIYSINIFIYFLQQKKGGKYSLCNREEADHSSKIYNHWIVCRLYSHNFRLKYGKSIGREASRDLHLLF